MATLLLPSHAASHHRRAVFSGGAHHHPLLQPDLLGDALHAAASRRRRPIAVACRAASAAARAKAPPTANAGPPPQALAKEAHKYFDHAVVSVRAGDGGHGAVLNMPPGPSADAAPAKTRGGGGRAADKGKAKKGSGKKVSFKRNYDGSVSLPVGGHGGDVVLYADEAEESLLGFHAKARHCAKRGGNVGATGTLSSRMHNGFAGETLRIPVPVGTVVRRKKGSVLADLAHPGDEVLVARGGQGGISLIDAPDYKRGKAMALSPNVMRDVTDKVLTHGQPGEEISLELILRVVADVDPVNDYKIVRDELRMYNPKYLERPYVVVLNKIDLPKAQDRLSSLALEISSVGCEECHDNNTSKEKLNENFNRHHMSEDDDKELGDYPRPQAVIGASVLRHIGIDEMLKEIRTALGKCSDHMSPGP
ncbi:unnamed protein product [Triticum turgidum subsp. durum]|uniref:Obg domain-containing protein n=1 Tax=Triticum turgidum subsp. durum TaxID=4567 RepID=A0A9R0XK23_TRITD|nr:unnamed protein product [Triticum turgidum subsp. durum]